MDDEADLPAPLRPSLSNTELIKSSAKPHINNKNGSAPLFTFFFYNNIPFDMNLFYICVGKGEG
jgi:hypothetical protein